MVSTCCISPMPTTCFLKEVRSFSLLGQRPAGSLKERSWEGLLMLPLDTSILFGATETGEEEPVPAHPDVKPSLLPLCRLREGQGHLQVRAFVPWQAAVVPK